MPRLGRHRPRHNGGQDCRLPSLLSGILALLLLLGFLPTSASAEFRAGAAAIDVSPIKFPVIVNGGFLNNTADSVKTALHARALVLDDGHLRIAIAVVDTCMMPRELIDAAKRNAAKRTGIPTT
ncbi:MAG: hypothetical protein GY872_19905, partial [Roseibacillus sp.]|nr:hypothetical protein [Roseibacillus sp.]